MAVRPVYSTLLIAAVGVEIDAGYTVPAGFVVAVRDVTVFMDGTPEDTAVSVTDPATGTYVYYRLGVDSDDYSHWEGRQIFPAGAEIRAESAGPNTVHVRVSGYLLSA